MSGGTAGRKAELKVSDDSGSTWTPVATTSIGWSPTFENADTTEQGDTGRARIGTLIDASVEAELNNKMASDAGQIILETAAYGQTEIDVRYYPQGSAGTGYEFTGLVTGLPHSNPVDGKASSSVTIEMSGGTKPSTGVAYA